MASVSKTTTSKRLTRRPPLQYHSGGPAPFARSAPLTPWSRGVLIVCCVLLFAVIAFAYAIQPPTDKPWISVISVLYRMLADGLLLLGWLASAAGLGAFVLLALPVRERAARAPANRDGAGGARPTNGDVPVANTALRLDTHGAENIVAGSSALLYWVTATALGLGLLSLITLGLGLGGWLNRATAIGTLVAGGVLGLAAIARSDLWRDRDAFGEVTSDWLRAPGGWAWLWLAAMPFLALAVITALLPPGVMWPGEPHWYDVVSYHLQLPREWYEIGRIVPLEHNVFSYFPLNVEMHYLLAMHLTGGPWNGMYVAQFMHLAMVALTVVAVYAFARADAPSRLNAVVAGLAVAVVPWMAQLGSIGYNEGGLLLFGTLAMGWAFRAALHPTRRLKRFAVAGLMAGFACGSKLTGVPEVLLAVGALAGLAVLVTHWQGRRQPTEAAPAEPALDDALPSTPVAPPPEEQPPADHGVPLGLRLAGVVTFFVAGVLAFAPWLVKNQAWAGNPVFPEAATVLGQAHFSDTQVKRWQLAHSARPDQQSTVGRLKEWTRQVWGNWQYGYLLVPLGLVAAAAAYDRPGTWMLLGMLVILSVFWLGFTHLQGRFFILALPIAALLVARMDWGPAPWAGALVVLMAAGFGYYKLHGIVYEKLAGDYGFVLAKQRLEEASTELPFVNIEPSHPVTVVFAPTLDHVPKLVPLTLVGDAKAFFYPTPMSRLFYRTVFDVDAKPNQSVLDAWAEGAPPEAGRLVDPDELRRFQRTYHGIPPFPAWYDDRLGPFVLPPVGVGEAGAPRGE